jgi:hypothetical protein
MNESSERSELAEIEELFAVVARSPIIMRQEMLAARLADWEKTRRSADVDDVVLAWIASHVRGTGRRSAAH